MEPSREKVWEEISESRKEMIRKRVEYEKELERKIDELYEQARVLASEGNYEEAWKLEEKARVLEDEELEFPCETDPTWNCLDCWLMGRETCEIECIEDCKDCIRYELCSILRAPVFVEREKEEE